jgi:hypothetical protein
MVPGRKDFHKIGELSTLPEYLAIKRYLSISYDRQNQSILCGQLFILGKPVPASGANSK